MASDPYKGVRDFYPEDERVQKYIFSAMRRAVERFGYEEMNASILELTDLYTAKTSEEIVSKQTYTFEDRGGRSVTLRPEMTPSIARMVAAQKRELGFPLRWYSIQNFFRYERPQRGRLREHWQLNADLFGAPSIEADIEIIAVAYRVMMELGASEKDFVIRVGSRQFLDAAYDQMGIPRDERQHMTRVLDAKGKGAMVPEKLLKTLSRPETFEYLARAHSMLGERGIGNALLDGNIARGFDYYTGMVFEVFDTNPENTRSMFGGGRYDNLVAEYGSDAVPAVGFGMGDVTARHFLEAHRLLPEIPPVTQLYLAPVAKKNAAAAAAAAELLRAQGVRVALGMGHEKVGDHIKAAAKLAIPYFAAYGDNEKASGTLTVKALATGEEKTLVISEVPSFLSRH